LEQIRTSEAYHAAAIRLLGSWARQDIGLIEAEKRLRAAFNDVFPPDRDQRWRDRVASIPEMLEWVWGKKVSTKATKATPERNSDAPRREIQLVDFDTIEARLDWTWLVEGLLMPEQISIVWAPPGCRKTFVCLDIALHVAARLTWFGRRVERGLAVYVAAEAGNTIRQRIGAWKIEHPAVKGIPFSVVPHSIDLCHAAAGDCDALIEKISHKAAGLPIALVVIDTVNRSLGGGNENGPEDMGAFSLSLDRFRDQLGAHVLGVHHCGKNPALGPRGHSLLEGNVDTEIEVTADELTKTSIITMHKQRDADLAPPFSFGLKPVILGTNQAGQIITSCIVTPADLTPPPKKKPRAKLPRGAQTAHNALIKAIDKLGTEPPPSNDIPRVRSRRARRHVADALLRRGAGRRREGEGQPQTRILARHAGLAGDGPSQRVHHKRLRLVAAPRLGGFKGCIRFHLKPLKPHPILSFWDAIGGRDHPGTIQTFCRDCGVALLVLQEVKW
jgi:hypothetical protein